MKKWICTICSYVYDEAVGDPDGAIAPGTKWEDIPDNWICPVCGAAKSDFEEFRPNERSSTPEVSVAEDSGETREFSFGELSALFSNLSKGCAKQYRTQEAGLFDQLAIFFKINTASFKEQLLNDTAEMIQNDLGEGYQRANAAASAAKDRGALRALVWGEKVSKIVNSLLGRYQKQSDALLESSRVFVCDICGFVFVGNELPEVCPVCKVPSRKFTEIMREAK